MADYDSREIFTCMKIERFARLIRPLWLSPSNYPTTPYVPLNQNSTDYRLFLNKIGAEKVQPCTTLRRNRCFKLTLFQNKQHWARFHNIFLTL